jgi:ectoine hydroxylase-related dioxygenase (phytanoyl-CoA dioxygenase family)
VVNPGGAAQVAHRDYHLGFMEQEQALRYPAHAHRLSPALTLQGAVAHIDMPVETGPTLYLPHSQKYAPGYLAFHVPSFTAYFNEHFVQWPLAKGDAAFFNPALFHGAGTNRTTDVRRMAHLLQVPTNLDRDQPVDGLAPPTQAGLMRLALSEKWDEPRFAAALADQAARRLPEVTR